MTQINANGITLEVETMGSRENPAVLLVMGLGAQMTAWPEDFCKQLSERGYFVIRFDNRDVGLSTWFDDAGEPNMSRTYLSALFGRKIKAPYSLSYIAEDCLLYTSPSPRDKA